MRNLLLTGKRIPDVPCIKAMKKNQVRRTFKVILSLGAFMLFFSSPEIIAETDRGFGVFQINIGKNSVGAEFGYGGKNGFATFGFTYLSNTVPEQYKNHEESLTTPIYSTLLGTYKSAGIELSLKYAFTALMKGTFVGLGIGMIYQEDLGIYEIEESTFFHEIKDFHYESLHKKIKRMGLVLLESLFSGHDRFILTRVNSENLSETINVMKKTWNSLSPVLPFEYSFLDEKLDNLYKQEINTGKIVALFSFLAIFLSCLGLFGLTAFMTEQRTNLFYCHLP